jgi:hypothetical protein
LVSLRLFGNCSLSGFADAAWIENGSFGVVLVACGSLRWIGNWGLDAWEHLCAVAEMTCAIFDDDDAFLEDG